MAIKLENYDKGIEELIRIVNTLEKEPNPSKAELNEIVEVLLKTSVPLSYDAYQNIRENGSAILIDETSFVTVGAVLFK